MRWGPLLLLEDGPLTYHEIIYWNSMYLKYVKVFFYYYKFPYIQMLVCVIYFYYIKYYKLSNKSTLRGVLCTCVHAGRAVVGVVIWLR